MVETYLEVQFGPQINESSYQITEIKIAITHEHNQILTFCEMQCFKFMEIFTDNQK